MAENIIELEGISKSFGDKTAVSNLDLIIGDRQIFGFIGPNGAGKTTTIRLILGLLKPDKGTVRILGKVIGDDREVYKKIGFVLHDLGLYEELSCSENLAYYAEIYGVSPSRIDELLKEVGLWNQKNAAVGTFSRGMKQKLALARALLHDPEILILDEPATGLDPEMQVWMREYLVKLFQRGKTIFLSSHNLFEVQQMCSHIGIIHGGEIVKSGRIDAILQEISSSPVEIEVRDPVRLKQFDSIPYITSYTVEGNIVRATVDRAESIPVVVKWFSDQHFEVTNVNRRSLSVEELYMKVVEGAKQ